MLTNRTNGYIYFKRYMPAVYTFGQILLDQKRFKDAERMFLAAKEMGFHADTVDLRIALTKVGQGLIEDAILCLHPIIENCTTDPDIYMLRAKLYFSLNKIFLSIADLTTVIELAPNHPEITSLRISFLEYKIQLKNKATEQVLRKDWALAVYYINQAIELDKSDWKLNFLRGTILGEMDRNEEGIQELLEALGQETRGEDRETEIRANIAILHNKVAQEFYRLGNYEKAVERCTISLNFNDQDPTVWRNRAEAYLKLADFTNGLNDLKHILEIEPECENTKIRLTEIYMLMARQQMKDRDFREALALLSQCKYYGGNSAELFFRQAKCHFLLEELELMQKDLIACLRVYPKHQQALSLLSLFEQSPLAPEFRPFPKREIQRKDLNLPPLPTNNEKIYNPREAKSKYYSSTDVCTQDGIGTQLDNSNLLTLRQLK